MRSCLTGLLLIFLSISQYADATSCPAGMVAIDSFCIDQHEVTNAEYQAQMGQGAFKGAPGYDRPNQPRAKVSWVQAKAYCESIGKRLPTEKEWLKAAGNPERLSDTSSGPNAFLCQKVPKSEVVYRKDRPADVCSKQKNAYGLCDILGNVWEWVSDSDKKSGSAYGGSSTSCNADDIFDFRSSAGGVYVGIRCAQDLPNKIAAKMSIEDVPQYPGSKKLCNEHVSGASMHILWKSFSTRDDVTLAAKYFEQKFHVTATPGEHESLEIVVPTNANLVIKIYPTSSAENFPGCRQKPDLSANAVILISEAMRK